MVSKINQFTPSKTKLFLRKKFIEAARLHGHLAFLTLISDYDEDFYHDPVINYESTDEGLVINNIYLIFDNELQPTRYKYWNKDLKMYTESKDIVAYIWIDTPEFYKDEYSVIRKLIGSIIRWSYYDQSNYGLDNSMSYRVVEVTSDPSYVLKVKLLPYIEDVKISDPSDTNFKFTK